jgi:hypothetical protein
MRNERKFPWLLAARVSDKATRVGKKWHLYHVTDGAQRMHAALAIFYILFFVVDPMSDLKDNVSSTQQLTASGF